MRTALTATVLATALALLLAGCGGTAGEAAPPQAGSNRPADTAAVTEEETGPEDAPTEEPTEEPAEQGPLAFGETITYEDGLSLTVSKPAPYKPSEYAAGVEGFSKFVAFTVTMVNGTPGNFDPSMFSTTLQSANVEGSEVYDEKVGGGPSTTLLPGREASFKVAYAVTDPTDLVLEASPSFEHNAAIYTG